MASSAHAQWRNKQARRSTDASLNDSLTSISAASLRAIVDSVRMKSIPRAPLALENRLMQPLLEPDLAESRVAGRNQRTLAELGSEVPRVRVNDNLAMVVARGEALADQFVETELLGTGHFGRAIQWRAHGNPGDSLGDVISRHGLNEYGWQPNRRSLRGFIGDARDELEELRRVNDRVRDPATFDQRFLSVLRSEVGTVGHTLGSHHGQRDVMPHTGCCGVLQKVTRGCGEELHDRRVLERWGVRDVDDDRRALKDLSQSLAGQRVDTRVWRSRDSFVALFVEHLHEFRSDKPCAADDDEFHVGFSLPGQRGHEGQGGFTRQWETEKGVARRMNIRSTLRSGPGATVRLRDPTPTGNPGGLGLCDGLGQRRKLLVEILRIDCHLLLDRRLCPGNGPGDLVGQRGLAHDDESRRP